MMGAARASEMSANFHEPQHTTRESSINVQFVTAVGASFPCFALNIRHLD
jgi:hypothetical protein